MDGKTKNGCIGSAAVSSMRGRLSETRLLGHELAEDIPAAGSVNPRIGTKFIHSPFCLNSHVLSAACRIFPKNLNVSRCH